MSFEKFKPNKGRKDTTIYEVQNVPSFDGQSLFQTPTNGNQIDALTKPYVNYESFELGKSLSCANTVINSDQFPIETNHFSDDLVVRSSNIELVQTNQMIDNDLDKTGCLSSDKNIDLQIQGNYFSRKGSRSRSRSINEYLTIRQSKKEKIEQMFAEHSAQGSDVSSKILKEYYKEFCREGQTCSDQEKKLCDSDENNNNNDDTNILTTSDSVGEATVLDSDDVSDVGVLRSRVCHGNVKRRTSSAIRKIQEIIQEEQLKDLRVKNFNDAHSSKYPVTKAESLSFKTNCRQRSKSRSKFAKINNDQAYRPFRRWLGVSTCVASDTRFIVQPGKDDERKWKEDKIGFENNAQDQRAEYNFLQAESERLGETTMPCSSVFEQLDQESDFKMKCNIGFGKEKTINQPSSCSQPGKCKDFRDPDLTTEPTIKIINVGEQAVEKSKCTDTGCECTSKQIVNVEGNEGVIHIHQQSHGTVGKMTNKAGSSNRDQGNPTDLPNNPDEETRVSTFKSLKKKLKSAQRKRQYINVQAVQDCEGAFPGQLSFKKGQVIKQVKTNQSPEEGMCYGYYRAGKLHRKLWGIYPASHVIAQQREDKQHEKNVNDPGVEENQEVER